MEKEKGGEKKAGPSEASYQSCIKLWPMVEHAKKFFWHHHTLLPTAQPGEQPSRHKETHTVSAVFIHKRAIIVTGIRL